ncbi:MAG: hypothetical protein CMB47_06485 [Euryarchaeota archaeon]|nr:hypothetical protein [Euryarchaeota archaeon]|tara:strand:+ start:51031 stop:51300 length:270 start_codon:yes stop_codon:yes gene_type:complete
MIPSRVVVGSIISATLMILSIYNFTIDNFSSTKAWSYLLLTPWPLVFALSPKIYLKNINKGGYDWEEESEEVNIENKDPIDSGYDIPIL